MRRETGQGAMVLIAAPDLATPGVMTRVFDMDDRARLPWRFYGALKSVLAGL